MQDIETWKSAQLAVLATKTQLLTTKEAKTYHVDFIGNAIRKVPSKITEEVDLAHFQSKLEATLTLFPVKNENNKFIDKAYLKAVSELKIELQKKHNLVSEGYFIAIFLPLGVAIGLPFGVVFKNIALGLPIGLGIGLAIGASLDQKAKKEGRII